MAIAREATEQIRARMEWLAAVGERLVIDADVHPSARQSLPAPIAERIADDPNYYHGRPLLEEDLERTLDHAGVDAALCWQNPAVTLYVDDPEENARRLGAANEDIARLGRRLPQRVIPAGWTDPKALGTAAAVALAERCVQELAMPVVKMNPAQNAYPIDDPMVMDVVDAIVALGAVAAFHFGADTPYTPVEGLAAVAERHPEHPLIAVHMGGGGAAFVEAEATYQGARALGLRRSNLFYVLSAKRDTHIESALISYAAAGAPWRHNIAAASDTPYSGMVWNFAAFRALFETLREGATHGDPRLAADPTLFDEDTIAGFMGGNLAKLIVEADRRILERGTGT